MKPAESRIVDAKGVRIHARIVSCEASRASPVVLLHGFTGSTESMEGIVSELRATRTTISIDLVGHGQSDAPADVREYSLTRGAEQVASVIEALELDRPHLLGYSMGGRLALQFCTTYAERARSALLVGASAGLKEAETRSRRIRDDEALADHILEVGLETFVEEWMAKSLFASQASLGEAGLVRSRLQRMRNRPQGLALSLRGMGTGAMMPLELSGLKIPTCFVAGALDEKFCALARAFGDGLPNSRFEIVSKAGHAAHLENQVDFGRIARAFFDRVDAGKTKSPEIFPGLHEE